MLTMQNDPGPFFVLQIKKKKARWSDWDSERVRERERVCERERERGGEDSSCCFIIV